MDQRDYQRILTKYRSPYYSGPAGTKADVEMLLTHMEAQNRALLSQKDVIGKLQAELKGAMKTMLAFTRALGNGVLEIPFALIDLLSDDDRLHVADVATPYGLVKRFSFRAGTDAKAGETDEPSSRIH